MTTSALSQPLPDPVRRALKKKRVLLVDASAAKCKLRAEALRRLGIEVDCAADIAEARCWWKADFYNLVLINLAKGLGHRDKFCEDVRSAAPSQQVMFLVGEPQYLAFAPNVNEEAVPEEGNNEPIGVSMRAALSPSQDDPPLHWGILEASRRISSVRAAAHARTRAMQDRPSPPRDVESRYAKQAAEFRSLDDLLRGEMQ